MTIRPRFFSSHLAAGLMCAMLIAGYIAEAQADDSGSISGVVSNSVSGQPIEGATISIYASAGPVLMRVKTNRSGHYAAVGLQPGSYSVFFTKDGLSPVEGQFQVCPGAQSSMSIRMSSWCSVGCFGKPKSTISSTSTTTIYLNRTPSGASVHCP